MSKIFGQAARNSHKASWKLALAAGALAAMMAGAMPAMALDPQSPDAANDNAANWRMGGAATGAYAYAGPRAPHRASAPHRSEPYASARSNQPAAPAPHKDFQDYK